MFTFDKKDFQRFAVSTVGAIALSAASVLAAVGPVRAAVPAPLTVADWQGNVEQQIDRGMQHGAVNLSSQQPREAIVAVRFTAEGDFAGATLARSSGVAGYDRHALKVARHIAYPVLPAGLRGRPQTVEMRLAYGATVQDLESRSPRYATADDIQVAAK